MKKKQREFWFEFKEGEPSKKKSQISAKQEMIETEEEYEKRHFLGKPKMDKNYKYCVIEWENARVGKIFPAKWMEFNLSTHLVTNNEAATINSSQLWKKNMEKWKKKQRQRTAHERLTKLFGHISTAAFNANELQSMIKDGTKLSASVKQRIKYNYLLEPIRTKEDKEMMIALIGEYEANQLFDDHNREYAEYNSNIIVDKQLNIKQNTKIKEKRNATYDLLSYGNSDINNTNVQSNIAQLRIGDYTAVEQDMADDQFNLSRNSKRLKKHRPRGEMDEQWDFNEYMSDDEDEQNMNDYDIMDDEESDHMSDNSMNVFNDDDHDSEDDEEYKKLKKALDEDLDTKEYPLPENNMSANAMNGYISSSDDDEHTNEWNISDDEEDENDIEDNVEADMGVKVVRVIAENDKKRKLNMDDSNHSSEMQAPEKKKKKIDKKSKVTSIQTITDDDVIRIFKRNGGEIVVKVLYMKLAAIFTMDPAQLRMQMKDILKRVASLKNKETRLLVLRKEL